MRYSDDLIEEIRLKNDIVDVISGYVKLQRKGSSYFGLCPFHNEKSPSFSVSPQKQMYYCFGCGAGGNVFTFIMQYENYTFLEALKFLAERAGVELPEPDMSSEARAQTDLRNTLLEINKLAAKYFYYQLRRESGKTARAYLRERGISEETMKRFGLGYSDKYSNDLYRFLKEKNYSDEILRESGLFQADEKRGMYDKFWNRVIYPIMDVNNRVIGFGGRVMGDAKPKYLNSPETKVFDKSRNLYGMNVARTSRKKYILLCEGYMDVISMHQAGFNNAVASLGTALTSQQASLLKRYTDEVLLLYDSDEAGIKAALRGIPILRSAGLNSRIVNLSPCKDPDEFIREEGKEAFQERLDKAQNSFLFEIEMLERSYDLSDPQGKSDFFHQAAQKLLQFEDEIERNSYTESVARRYHIEYETLHNLVKKLALKSVGIAEPVRPKSGQNKKTEKESGIEKAQKLMLTWITSYPQIMEDLSGILSPEDFVTPLYRQVAEKIFEQYHQGEILPAKVMNEFPEAEEQSKVAALFNEKITLETEEERRRALTDVIANMKQSSIEYRMKNLDPADMPGLQKLIQDKKELEKHRMSGWDLHSLAD